MGGRKLFTIGLLAIGWSLLGAAGLAAPVGWDSNDFLITGGPNLTDRIGVFDFDLSFKGYLDTNFLPVSGMDFDAAGHLVAGGGQIGYREVRVYDSSGAKIRGFVRNDSLFGYPSDVKVAPDGTYLVGTGTLDGGSGVRQFATDGTYLHQYGSANLRSVAVVPGNQFWTGEPGKVFVNVFDLASGASVGTIGLNSPGQQASSMTYLAATNTVLVVDGPNHRVVERDLSGATWLGYDAPFITTIGPATVGPNNEIFATDYDQVLHWRRDGTYLGSFTVASIFGGGGSAYIVWAGSVPEPTATASVLCSCCAFLARRVRHRVS